MLDCARNHVIYFKTASYWYGLPLVSVVNFDRLPLFVKQIGKEIISKKFWQDALLCFGYHPNTFRMSSHWYHSSSRESNILQWLTYWVCSQMSVRRYSWNSFSENPSYHHAHHHITYIWLFVSRIIHVTLLFFLELPTILAKRGICQVWWSHCPAFVPRNFKQYHYQRIQRRECSGTVCLFSNCKVPFFLVSLEETFIYTNRRRLCILDAREFDLNYFIIRREANE